MPQTHYYYAINRKAAERVFDLTWNQFLDKYGWSRRRSQWPNIGGYLSFCLGNLPEEPTAEEIAPILRRSIRETLRQKSAGYFCMLLLGQQLGKRSFIKSNVDAERLEEDLDGLNVAAVWGFLFGDIDDRTLWSVLTLNQQSVSDLFKRWKNKLTKTERHRIHAAIRRVGAVSDSPGESSCRPLFDWQSISAVRDGHSVLAEEDTRRFVRFLRLAWEQNWPVYSDGPRLLHFRDFELARRLHRACQGFLGNCLVYYWGS